VIPIFTKLLVSGIADLECSQNIMSLITHANELYISGSINYRGIDITGALKRVSIPDECHTDELLQSYHSNTTLVIWKTKKQRTNLHQFKKLVEYGSKLSDLTILSFPATNS
jgi:16S rRNA C1402 (ribose-2'-O) methylase RsmI